jgi:hypothetical protein
LRHAVKITALALGLGFLFWWGWSGNFLFKRGALFSLSAREDYYALSAGSKDLGFARRTVSASGPERGFEVAEESAVELPIPGLSVTLRVRSVSRYGADGRLASAVFTLENPPGAEARAVVNEGAGTLECSVALGGLKREKSLPLPREGPILVSGVVPWLSRQSEAPLGRAMFARVLDLASLEFEEAQLTVTDDTAESVEVQVFRVAVQTRAGEAAEWVEGGGRILGVTLAGSGMALRLLEAEDAAARAKEALARPPEALPLDSLPEGALEMIDSLLPGA